MIFVIDILAVILIVYRPITLANEFPLLKVRITTTMTVDVCRILSQFVARFLRYEKRL